MIATNGRHLPFSLAQDVLSISYQFTLHNEQEEGMREFMYKLQDCSVLLKGHSSATYRITVTIIISSNIISTKILSHQSSPFSTMQFL